MSSLRNGLCKVSLGGRLRVRKQIREEHLKRRKLQNVGLLFTISLLHVSRNVMLHMRLLSVARKYNFNALILVTLTQNGSSRIMKHVFVFLARQMK